MISSHYSIDLLNLPKIGERVAGSNLVVHCSIKPMEKGVGESNSKWHIFLVSHNAVYV